VHTVEVLQQAPAVEAGRVIFHRRACVTCHSVDGSRHTGPTLLGVYGSEVKLSTGQTVLADEDYIRRSILKPDADLVAGYQPEMTAYPNIRPGELSALVAYIRSLREEGD
jgi:cytochrome c oxidase subunit 2